MKKLNLFIIFLIVLCSLGRAQNSAFYKYTGTSATSSPAVYLIGTSTAYHKITWNVSGTVSACTVAVDSSSDGVIWTAGGVISGQTCTSNGSSSVINTVVNYIRITFTAFTGTGSVIVSYTGYSNLSGGVTSFNTRTGAVTLTASDVNAIGTISNSTTGNAATATAVANIALTSLTDGSTVSWSLGGTQASASLTLAHTTSSRTINLSSLTAGQWFQLEAVQDSTGGATLSFGTGCTFYINTPAGFTSGSTPSINTAANGISVLRGWYDGTNCFISQ